MNKPVSGSLFEKHVVHKPILKDERNLFATCSDASSFLILSFTSYQKFPVSDKIRSKKLIKQITAEKFNEQKPFILY